jgi:hypothetical protein
VSSPFATCSFATLFNTIIHIIVCVLPQPQA